MYYLSSRAARQSIPCYKSGANSTQNVMEHAGVTSLSLICEAGLTLHAAYVKERLEEASVSVYDTIKRNNIPTFVNRPDPKKKGTQDSGVQR